jgi:hypothetical protein
MKLREALEADVYREESTHITAAINQGRGKALSALSLRKDNEDLFIKA